MIQTYMNEEIFEKLEMSKTEVTELTLRDLRCPNCRFLIDKIYSDIRPANKIQYLKWRIHKKFTY